MNKMCEAPERIWIDLQERKHWFIAEEALPDEGDVEYILKSVADKETGKRAKSAYGYGKTDATKNIRAVYESIKKSECQPYFGVEGVGVTNRGRELWNAVLEDLKRVKSNP